MCGCRPTADSVRKADGRWLLAARATFLDFGGPTERLGPADSRREA